MKTRVISLYQPYATLVVLGQKQFETRSWRPSETLFKDGPVLQLIHAAKTYPKWCRDFANTMAVKMAIEETGLTIDMAFGAIIGSVDFIGTHTSEAWLSSRMIDTDQIDPHWARERHFGDYSPGRYAWEFENPRMYDVPIQAKGSQGFWYYDLPVQPAGF